MTKDQIEIGNKILKLFSEHNGQMSDNIFFNQIQKEGCILSEGRIVLTILIDDYSLIRRNRMKALHIIFGLIIFQAFIGCKQNQFENMDKLVLLNSYRRDSVWKTDSLFLNKSISNDTLGFIYKQKTDTFGYSFFKSTYNDSLIYIYGLNCPLVATKTFKIDNNDFKILKYYYDEENSVDEESSFFYHENYGLLVCFNDGWLDLIFSIEYDNTSKILIDSIINDRSGFYLQNSPPPPPLLDSLIIKIGEYGDF